MYLLSVVSIVRSAYVLVRCSFELQIVKTDEVITFMLCTCRTAGTQLVRCPQRGDTRCCCGSAGTMTQHLLVLMSVWVFSAVRVVAGGDISRVWFIAFELQSSLWLHFTLCGESDSGIRYTEQAMKAYRGTWGVASLSTRRDWVVSLIDSLYSLIRGWMVLREEKNVICHYSSP